MANDLHRKQMRADRAIEPKEHNCGEPNPCADRDGEDRPPVNLQPGGREEKFSGFVIVRLGIDRVDTGFGRLEELARKLNLEGLTSLLEEFGNPPSRPLIRSLEARQILEMEATAAKSKLPPLRSLTSYWRLDLRERPEAIEALVDRLNDLSAVAIAYRELAVSEPVVDDSDDPYASGQGYLDAAPTGFDARWAWTQPNGEGAGVGVVDLEQGWFLTHEDLAGKAPTIIFGDNKDGVGSYKGNHGTAVLGEIAADDNTLGVVGAAPSVSSVRVTSHYDAGTDTNLHVADALVAAVAVMDAGDVILLEVQRSLKPTEIDDADFDAIRLASALGVIVVEAAGNGNSDLDAYTNAAGDSILNRSSGDFRESGAIMVGSSTSAVPHERYVGCGSGCGSNYGTRIDCFGWGHNITTAGYGDLDGGTGDDSTYTDTFGGTSGASPMITGASLIVQGMYEANTGTRLSPGQMRSLLSDPLTGTLQGSVVAGAIGVMPNLRTILSLTLGLVPDVYLRDNVSDTGAIPSTGSISASPDIIVRPEQVADGNASFGEASGTANNASLGSEVEAGQDNFIYVRMRNRGVGNAIDATATVYWSEVATLVTPDMWNEIGTTNPINVPSGDTLVVAPPLTWDQNDIPGGGHYCFVGIVDHAFDERPPVPPGPPYFDWDAFRDFVRNHNNVTWRNFNVVDDVADPMPFLIAGTPRGDIARVFDFQIIRRLPEGVEVFLEVPVAVLGQIRERGFFKHKVDRKKGVARILLPAQRSLGLCGVRLPAGARLRSRFVVKPPRKTRLAGHSLAIRQLYEGEEVGRITWSFEARDREDRLRG